MIFRGTLLVLFSLGVHNPFPPIISAKRLCMPFPQRLDLGNILSSYIYRPVISAQDGAI